MRPGLRLLVGVSLVTGLGLGAAIRPRAQTGQQSTFRSTVDVVAVDVSVRDGAATVPGLGGERLSNPRQRRAADDHGHELRQAAHRRNGRDSNVSYSERGAPLARLEQGVRTLAAGLLAGDRRLITFNQDVRRVLDFSDSRPAIEAALGTMEPGGGTSVYDALTTALLAPTSPERRQLVMVFTDGGDTASVTEPLQLLEAARRAQASVTAVMPRESVSTRRNGAAPGPSAGLTAQVRLIAQLTTATGGQIPRRPGPPTYLGAPFRLALDSFRASYVLYFAPQGVDRSGDHTLEVSLPGHPHDTLLARTGYFGG